MTSFSCEKEEQVFVDADLLPYFNTFSDEAAARGVTFDYEASRIEGHLTDIEEQDVLGKCQFNSVDPDKVFIDNAFWRRASHLEKEFLIFHELGHCFLERDHLDTQNSDGTCISMMQSGLGECDDNYNSQTRSDYLDELFSNR